MIVSGEEEEKSSCGGLSREGEGAWGNSHFGGGVQAENGGV